ncbi:hypothetical protein ZIOFF_036692 [Zingiber officinale]|uniref:Zinc finger-XS domain-containing protein n=1 Tax=Zingiber officinale TaxID=94328 RepID=A0A8J5GAE1_ZINOF|nr:hypothetical protein ZIOFF_036692 [Zingiber officinale]
MENGFSLDEDTNVRDSEVDDYAEKRTGNYRILNIDDTFRCPFFLDKKKQCYQFKDLFQHAIGIDVSNSHKGSLKARHCAFARFLQHDLAYPLPRADLKATVIAATDNSEPPPEDEELFVWPWMAVLVNVDPSDIEGEANSVADELADFHPTDTVFLHLHLEDETGG